MKRLARFMEFHFEARYPDEHQKFYKKCTKEFATKKIKEIRGLCMVEKEVIESINRFVKELRRRKIRVEKVILYGSRILGKAHEFSDIDVAIISPDFGKDRYREGAKLFEIASEVDTRIEPVPISLWAYENNTWVPLIYEIREKGLDLKVA